MFSGSVNLVHRQTFAPGSHENLEGRAAGTTWADSTPELLLNNHRSGQHPFASFHPPKVGRCASQQLVIDSGRKFSRFRMSSIKFEDSPLADTPEETGSLAWRPLTGTKAHLLRGVVAKVGLIRCLLIGGLTTMNFIRSETGSKSVERWNAPQLCNGPNAPIEPKR